MSHEEKGQKATNNAYRSGWDRIFGAKEDTSNSEAQKIWKKEASRNIYERVVDLRHTAYVHSVEPTPELTTKLIEQHNILGNWLAAFKNSWKN